MHHSTLTTGQILRSGYLGNRCHGNQKTFAWLISHPKSNGFPKGRALVWKETVTVDFCYHGNHHVVMATKNVPLWGRICETESAHIHFFLSNSHTLMLCCVIEATPLTTPSERVKALVLLWNRILWNRHVIMHYPQKPTGSSKTRQNPIKMTRFWQAYWRGGVVGLSVPHLTREN